MRNRFDLAALIRASGRRMKRRAMALKGIGPSRKAERTYRKAIEQIVIEAARATRNAILPAVQAGPGSAQGSLDGLKTLLVRITPDVTGIVTNLLHREAGRHRAAWIETIEAATGVDLGSVISEGDLADEFAVMVRRNVALIENLSDDVYHRIERSVMDAVLNGTRPAELRKTLTEQLGITQRRARLIARDQMAKATSDLTRLRQEQAGITEYIWSTSLDERVRGNPQGLYPKARPSHWAREGKKFRWDSPPEDGSPGKAVNCRCVARPFIDLTK